MSRLYDTVEPSVIDEEMLHLAVEEQGPQEEAGKIAKVEGVNYEDVLSLRLDFKNILKIDNLWEFTSLTKLQLDNNIIERIEGLDTLIHLVWLDLSFNNIEVIQGLSQLTKLEDLTLYNNRISRIENMDSLQNLHVFSIGNNEIKEMKDILYLRNFRNLKSLNINNNPVCHEDDFRQYVVAFLPNLEFFNYRLIDESEKIVAYDCYQHQVEEQADRDMKETLFAQVQKQKQEELQHHIAACVERMNTDQLFIDMYADDPEGNKMNQMPGVSEMILSFKEKLMAVCQQMFDFGLQEFEKRKAEVDMFWECVNEAKQENKELGIQAIGNFLTRKEEFFKEMQTVTNIRLAEKKIAEYSKLVSGLWDTLMGLELQIVDQLEEVIKEFERNLHELVSVFLESVQGYLTHARELENIHNEKLTECATTAVEKGAKNELDEDLPEELRILLIDKDTVLNAITSSHDVHLLKIDNKEDEIVTRIKTWMKEMIDRIHQEEEIDRNRARVIEINHLIDYLREELANVEKPKKRESRRRLMSLSKFAGKMMTPQASTTGNFSATTSVAAIQESKTEGFVSLNVSNVPSIVIGEPE